MHGINVVKYFEGIAGAFVGNHNPVKAEEFIDGRGLRINDHFRRDDEGVFRAITSSAANAVVKDD